LFTTLKSNLYWPALIGALLFLGSCVPVKKLIYFQNDDLKHRDRIPKDTVLRTHKLNIQEYRIQPLDMLSINFETLSDESDAFDFLSKIAPQGRATGSSSASAGIMVDTYGEIEYAVLGKIKVSGLTIFEAKALIQNIASKYLPNVIVRIRMLNFRFTLLGEVGGEQVATSSNPRLTMSEAIGMAGGFSELADRSNVKVIRQKGDSVQVYYVNLLEEKFLESEYYYVQQNDVIIVPPLKQRTFKKYFTSNMGIVSSIISFGLFILALSNMN
jgi:polysaccharide biosynthesis/export protein